MAITVFASEKSDGLSEMIERQGAISYLSPISDNKKFGTISNIDKEKAKSYFNLIEENDIDLHVVPSIMVSTVWNLNDDVMTPSEVFAARKTPKDKPFNYMHDCNDIIGHIVDVVPIDANSDIIQEKEDMAILPDFFHLITKAVVYKFWSDTTKQEKINKIISEIPLGKWFVSMECLFSGFDYAIKEEGSNDYRIIVRNEHTSFLTKYLRCYGGSGKYQQFKIGRVLRNITFCGKGLVTNPANPDSIIFAENKNCESGKCVGENLVYYSSGSFLTEKEMENMMNLEQALAKIESLQKELEKVLASKAEELAKLEAANAKAKEEFDKVTEQFTKLKAENTTTTEKLLKIEKEQLIAKRISVVSEKLGVDNKEATDLVEASSMMNDEQFTKFVETSAACQAKKAEKQPEVTPEEVEKAKLAKEAALATAGNSEDEKTEELRKLIAEEYLASKKTNVKKK